MKNKITLIIIGIFLISIASAQLLISPNPIDISQKIDENHTYYLTLTNTFNFSITDFQFSNLQNKGFIFQDITIPANSTIISPFYVQTESSMHEIIESKVSFKYAVNLPDEVITENIIISENGFSNTYTIIKQGDTIVWFNTDDKTHRIYSTIFSPQTLEIAPNQTKSFTFNTIGSFNYFDEDYDIFNQFNGHIDVINKTSEQKAHNPNYDKILTINLNSFLNPTNISVENSGNNYSIEYTKFKKGLITIKNIGNETAELIKLTSPSDWITFEQNNFNLEPGDTEWVEYTIYPTFLSTNDTDKTYTKTISVKATNSNEITSTLSVYIPYKEITLGEGGQNDLEYYSTQFCPKNPCAPICMALLGYPVCNYNSTTTRGSGGENLTLNVTSEDWKDTLDIMSKLSYEISRLKNEFSEFKFNTESETQKQTEIGNESLSLQKQNEKTQKQRTNTIFWIGSIIFIISIVGLVIDSEHKKKFGRSIIGDTFNFKKQ